MSETQPTLLSPRVLIPFVIVTLVWGSTWLVIHDQISAAGAVAVPAVWSVAYRFGLAAIAMFAIAAWRGERLGDGMRGQGLAALVGISQFMLNFNFVYRAEHLLTSGVVAVFYALLIVPNSLLSRAFLGTPVSRRFLAGGSIAVIGVALLLTNEARQMVDASGVLLGALLSIGGLLCCRRPRPRGGNRFSRCSPGRCCGGCWATRCSRWPRSARR
jgi:drug/metabolite transporter (DMT)-like permease